MEKTPMAQRTKESPHAPGPDGRRKPLPGLAAGQVVGQLQGGYRQDVAWAVAAVARLRREAGREAHVSPTAWGLQHLEKLADLRDERATYDREARVPGTVDPAYLSSKPYVAREVQELREDTAVHLAVTLWALHQQSLRDEAMHQPGWTLGRAARRLAHGATGTRDQPAASGAETGNSGSDQANSAVEEASEAIRRRFVRIGTASDSAVLATRLRELVLLLRSARIPLDYALLADQLLQWQDENQRDVVLRTWGRDFHRRYRPAADARPGDGDDSAAASPEVLEDPDEFDGDA
jgi:CRISPR system Cascade subunit CasB